MSDAPSIRRPASLSSSAWWPRSTTRRPRRGVPRPGLRGARRAAVRARAGRRRLGRRLRRSCSRRSPRGPARAGRLPVAQLRPPDGAHRRPRPRPRRRRRDARRRPPGPARADPDDARALARAAPTSSTRCASSARARRASSSRPRAGSTGCSTSSPRSSSSRTRATSACWTAAPLDALLSMRERNRFLRGMTVVGRLHAGRRPLRAATRATPARPSTRSRKMLRFSLDAISSFSHRPLQLATLLGFVFSAIAFVAIPVVVGLRIAGAYVPGFGALTIARAAARRHPADRDRDHRRVRRAHLRRGQGPPAVPRAARGATSAKALRHRGLTGFFRYRRSAKKTRSPPRGRPTTPPAGWTRRSTDVVRAACVSGSPPAALGAARRTSDPRKRHGSSLNPRVGRRPRSATKDPRLPGRGRRRPPGRAAESSRCRGPRAGGPRPAPDGPGLPTTVEFGGHVVDDDGVGADLGAVTDGDRAQQLGPRADGDVVLHRGVACRRPGPAERHGMVERDVVADLGRLADDHAGPWSMKNPSPIVRRGVDLDAGHRSRQALR